MKTAISKLKVAVLMGGISEERDISIKSGTCIADAIKDAGLNVVTADIGPDNLNILQDGDIDVFFIALHGRFGEDGQLQQILEDKSLIYTGSGPAASKLAFNKWESKKAFIKADILTPAAILFEPQADMRHLQKQLTQLAEKYVIKPLRQGSTIGISIVDDPKSAVEAAQQCFSKFGDCMIEKFIPGREITVGILDNRALPIIEIKSKNNFYDYHAKYIDDRTEYLFDTIKDPLLVDNISAAAIDCFKVLGCRHFARADFILGDDRKPYALEINTVPGFTSHSLLPKAAQKAGLSMKELCLRIIKAALENKNNKQPILNRKVKSKA